MKTKRLISSAFFIIFFSIIVIFQKTMMEKKIMNNYTNFMMSSNEQIVNEYCQISIDTCDLFLNQKQTLIYRYFGSNCDQCIIEDLYWINYIIKNGSIDVRILLTTPESKNNYIKMSNIFKDFDYQFVDEGLFRLFPYQDERYFAIVNLEGELSNIFFPNSRYTYIEEIYAKKIAKILVF